MSELIKISDRFTVSRTQPTKEDFSEIKQQGFQSVVNLRTAEEQDLTLSPSKEGEIVRDLVMEYLHLPVSRENLDSERVDRFRQETAKLPKPILVHCHTGRRSGAFVMMDVALTEGMTGEETLQKAKDMGFKCDVPRLEDFVKNYVDRYQKGEQESVAT
ncbi:beta-lactamase hydrolase domain-containing protein [Myxosarcina sp. GI1(2024)]